VLNRKMIGTFLMVSTSSINMQSLGRQIELRAPAVGAKMWCLFYVFLSRLVSVEPFARVGYNRPTLNSYCVAVYGSILILSSPFSEMIALSEALDSSYFRR